MTASPLSEYLTLLFESKSMPPASDLYIVEDNARRPSRRLVSRAVAADNLSGVSCRCILGESFSMIGSIDSDSEADELGGSSEFGYDQGSSRWDSTGTKNKKREPLTRPPARRSSLEAPSRPKLTRLKNKLEKTRRSDFKEGLPEWLRRLPTEDRSGERDASKLVNEALMVSSA
jgi:hypothetical protein